MQNKLNEYLNVYIAEIPTDAPIGSTYPALRNEEIDACKSEKVRREKYYVWKLLQYALQATLDVKIEDVEFTKTARGKWECPLCFFSLSHSKNAVAAAISDKTVGVDVELFSPSKINRLGRKILTQGELLAFSELTEDQKPLFLTEKWTQKESVFKAFESSAHPAHIDTASFKTFTKTLELREEVYVLSVCGKEGLKPCVYEGIDLS